jgi:hypothetical protein
LKINNIGPNQTELYRTSGTRILISYSTPVAAVLNSGRRIKTSTKYSNTTTRHINSWLGSSNSDIVPQYELDWLLDD